LFDGVSAARGAPARGRSGAGVLSGSARLDALKLLVEVFENLVGAEVEDGAAGRDPAASLVEEDRRGVAQVADRRQPLHVAALDRLETNRDADQNGELSRPPVARQREAIVPLALDPAQAARPARGRGQVVELRLQVLALLMKRSLCLLDRQRPRTQVAH